MRSLAALLAKHAPFDAVPPELLARLALEAKVTERARGSRVWSEGEPLAELVVVQRGVVRVGADGGPYQLYGRGQTLSVSTTLLGLDGTIPRTDAAEALDDALIATWPLASMRAVVDVRPAFGWALGRLAALEAQRAARQLARVLRLDAVRRVADLTLELAEDFGAWDPRGTLIDVKIPQRELAAMVGLTRETVSVSLVDLRQRGWIDQSGRRLVVLDAPALRRFVSGAERADSDARRAGGV